MEETGLENMTENTEKEKVLSKEAIVAALNERHSPEKQKLLSAGRVAIAGLGGLGSNVAYALARIGVGHLHLIDFDVVDITNLNRQQGLYRYDVGVDANGFRPVSLDEVLAWFDGVPCSGRVDWRNWVNETGSKAVSRKLAGCK